MHHTPWTQKSSLPSDRLRSSNPQPQKSKGKGKSNDPPKSKQVQALESLANGLRSASLNTKDPKGGCFCQAREHSLSLYTSICHNCGLILCKLNLAQYSCPHCACALINGTTRDNLISRLEAQIAAQIAKEAAELEMKAEQARQAVGAFPTLGDGPPRSQSQPPSQTHKVLSLNSKTKRVIVSSYTTSPASSSNPASRVQTPEPEPTRVPPPPSEVPHATMQTDPTRPWRDLRGQELMYVPVVEEKVQQKSSRKKRGKGKDATENAKAQANEGTSYTRIDADES